jgi:hypothetical protein
MLIFLPHLTMPRTYLTYHYALLEAELQPQPEELTELLTCDVDA